MAALLGALAFRLALGPYPLGDTLRPALAPAVYLLGIALLLGNLTGSYWIAAGAVVGYWWFEILAGREVSGLLYLFNHRRPAEGVHAGWNRALLTAAGAGPLTLNACLAARRPGRWR
ncbi:MAG: hypothetical protein QJR03_04700 [Sphaerobacter sp.]|nr:hypothetical protein [Sphaerobacter sp.]